MRSRLGLAILATALTVPVAAGTAAASSPPPTVPAPPVEGDKPVETLETIGTEPASAGSPESPGGPEAAAIAGALTSTLSGPLRFGLFVDINGTSIDLTADRPVASGQFDGTAVALSADIGPWFGILGIDVPAETGAVEAVLADTSLYFRSPLLAEVGRAGGAGPLAELATIGDGWGRIDLVAASGSTEGAPADIGQVIGMIQDSEALITQVLGSVAINDLGDETIDTTPVHGYEILLPADGDDESAGPGEEGGTVPLEVWVDQDQHVRRIAFTIDPATIAQMSGDLGGIPQVGDALGTTGALEAELSLTIRFDLSDFGSTDITVAVPTESVDLTAVVTESV